MNPNEQALMERYIYQVTRRLSKNQRKEVALELEELIGDMLESTGSMEAVLTKLGDPKVFARKYQDDRHYLIGPEYFDAYLWFLKIVLLCTAVPILLVSIIEGVQTAGTDTTQSLMAVVIKAVVNGIIDVVGSCVGAFGGITLVFAVMERQKMKFEIKKEKEWSVGDLESTAGRQNSWTPDALSPIPSKNAAISKGDSVVGIVFIVLFCVLLIFAPQLIGVYFKNGESLSSVPIFNLQQWHIILPFFVLWLFIGLADEIFKLVMGRYCKPVMISNIICGGIQMVLTVVILKMLPLWNPHFISQLQTQFGGSSAAQFFIDKWDGDFVSNCLVVFFLAVTLLEIGTTIYKTLRYGSKTQ